MPAADPEGRSARVDPADFVTVVTGIPRSGTSAMMQMLAAGGVPPLQDASRAPDRHNPHGYFEYAGVKALADGTPPDWLARARGHAVKVIHRLAPRLPADDSLRVVWMRRAMPAVLASQEAMAPTPPGQDTAGLGSALGHQLLELETWLATRVAGRWLRVDYEALCDDPAATARAVNQLLGGGLDEAAMTRSVDPGARHQI